MSQQRNEKTLAVMRTILERSVGAYVLKARDVCDAVLTSDGLRADRNPAFWMTAFGLVRRWLHAKMRIENTEGYVFQTYVLVALLVLLLFTRLIIEIDGIIQLSYLAN